MEQRHANLITFIGRVTFVCRTLLGFLFIYHGLVPKILWLDAIEIELVNLSGSIYPATVLSPLAGICEIFLGVSIIWSRSLIPVYIAAVMLSVLLVFSGVVMPELLTSAFNPVTTNLMGLGLCYLIWYSKGFSGID